MKIFLDTEFSNLTNGQLMSLGMVDELGNPFYGETRDWDYNLCSDFVHKVVIPLLNHSGDECSYATSLRLRDEVLHWLAGYDDPEICYDYKDDWELFSQLLGNRLPSNLRHRNIRDNLSQGRKNRFFKETGFSRHHALNDAMANRYSYREVPTDVQ